MDKMTTDYWVSSSRFSVHYTRQYKALATHVDTSDNNRLFSTRELPIAALLNIARQVMYLVSTIHTFVIRVFSNCVNCPAMILAVRFDVLIKLSCRKT